MAHETIGTAVRTDKPLEIVSGVQFTVPYGEKSYQVALTDEEMEKLLRAGVERLLAQRAILAIGNDFTVELEPPDLPLFVRCSGFELRTREDSSMVVHVATMSEVNLHHGKLTASRGRTTGWRFVDYSAQSLRKLE